MHKNVKSIGNAQFFKEVENKNLSLVVAKSVDTSVIEELLNNGFNEVTDNFMSRTVNTGTVTLDSKGFYRTNGGGMRSYYRKAGNMVFRIEKSGKTYYFCVAKESYKMEFDWYEVKDTILYRLEGED